MDSEQTELEGLVYIPREVFGEDKVYFSGIRPHVMTRDGLVSCEITLDGECRQITVEPQRAKLRFFYPVDFDFDQKEVTLYALNKVMMKFLVD